MIQTRIFCVSCRANTPATKRRGQIAGAGGTCWLNVCQQVVDEATGQRCGHQHPAPPPDLAARNARQRKLRRHLGHLERHGQQVMFSKKGER